MANCKQGETANLRLLTSDYLLALSEFPFMGELVDCKMQDLQPARLITY